jgi:hypothetical protein
MSTKGKPQISTTEKQSLGKSVPYIPKSDIEQLKNKPDDTKIKETIATIERHLDNMDLVDKHPLPKTGKRDDELRLHINNGDKTIQDIFDMCISKEAIDLTNIIKGNNLSNDLEQCNTLYVFSTRMPEMARSTSPINEKKIEALQKFIKDTVETINGFVTKYNLYSDKITTMNIDLLYVYNHLTTLKANLKTGNDFSVVVDSINEINNLIEENTTALNKYMKEHLDKNNTLETTQYTELVKRLHERKDKLITQKKKLDEQNLSSGTSEYIKKIYVNPKQIKPTK